MLSGLAGGADGLLFREPEQLPLFGRSPGGTTGKSTGKSATLIVSPEKKGKLNRAIDRIREKYGEKSVAPGMLRKKGD